MSPVLVQVLAYLGALVAFAAVLLVVDSLFLGAANRLKNPADQFRHRIATELPRVPHD